MSSKLRVHWIPVHTSLEDESNIRVYSGDWLKIVYDQPSIPYLEEIDPRCTVLARAMPMTDPTTRGFADLAAAVTQGIADAELCWLSAQDAQKRGFPGDRLVFSCRNEARLDGDEAPALTVAYQVAFLRRLHEHGLRCAVGGFGVGWPGTIGGDPQAGVDWNSFQSIRDTMNVPLLPDGSSDLTGNVGDLLELHQYWNTSGPNGLWPNGDMLWPATGGRHLQCPWQVPIVIGECGECEAVATQLPNEGWQKLPGGSTDIQAAEYMPQLAWFDQQIMADPRIICAFVFTYDASKGSWVSFLINGDSNPLWKLLVNYWKSDPQYVPWSGVMAIDRWHPIVEYRAQQAGLDPHVVAAVIQLESAGRFDAVSSAGAVGLMQVEPDAVIPGRPAAAVLLNPDQNLKCGCQILANCLTLAAGNLTNALAYYYGAPGAGSQDGQVYLAAFNYAWHVLWPALPNPVAGAVPTPAPQPAPTPAPPPSPTPMSEPVTLPQQEPATDAPTLADKCRWWTEELARQQQAGNMARAAAILDGLINLSYGLMYRLEKALGG